MYNLFLYFHLCELYCEINEISKLISALECVGVDRLPSTKKLLSILKTEKIVERIHMAHIIRPLLVD